MNLLSSILLLLGCRSTTADLGVNSNAGCAPDCRGTCFAGNCLFAANEMDDEDTFRSSQLKQAAPSVPISFPQTAAGLPELTPGLPPQPQQLQQFIPSATATAGLGFQSMGVLENKAQELSFELQRAEAHEALLRAQNEKLKQQLEDWKVAGTDIAQRESKVMSLLGSPLPQQAPSAALPAVALVAQAEPPSFLQAARQRWDQSSLGRSYFGTLLMTAGILFIVASAWKTGRFVQRYRKGEVSWQSMSQALANNSSSQRLQPVLRAMGLAQYKVEVSEIHLGSLFAGSTNVRVNFRMGNGVERRTQVLKSAGGTFLRFDDVLELSLCGSDKPCTICITDGRGDLAHVALASSHLLRLATRPHQEYFRTELTASRELGDLAGRRPYVAMRMRNVTAPPTVPAVPANVKGYGTTGSFAV